MTSPVTLLAAVAFHALAFQLAGAADSRCLFARALFRRLFKVTAQLHLAVDAFTLQFLFQRAKSLVDVVVANENLHKKPHLLGYNRPEPRLPHTHDRRGQRRGNTHDP